MHSLIFTVAFLTFNFIVLLSSKMYLKHIFAAESKSTNASCLPWHTSSIPARGLHQKVASPGTCRVKTKWGENCSVESKSENILKFKEGTSLWLRKCDLPSLTVWDLCLVKDIIVTRTARRKKRSIHTLWGRAKLTVVWKDALKNATPVVLSAFLTKSQESRVSAAFFTVCKVTSAVLGDFWCVDVSCHPQSCSYSWARPIETELCCFAAGQLSWTISVVTALWSQVVVCVYHKAIIPGWISSDRRVFCFLKHLLLAFSWVLVRWRLRKAFPAAAAQPRALRAPCLLSPALRSSSSPSSSLSVAVRCPRRGALWQEWKERSSRCWAPRRDRHLGRAWRRVRCLAPAARRSKPINLQCHSTYCDLIALFLPQKITVEANTLLLLFLGVFALLFWFKSPRSLGFFQMCSSTTLFTYWDTSLAITNAAFLFNRFF